MIEECPAQIDGRNHSARKGVPHDEPLGKHGVMPDLVEKAQTIQNARRVRGELKSGPQLGERFGLFDHVGGIAGPGHGERRGQASDAATDNQEGNSMRQQSSSASGRGPFRFIPDVAGPVAVADSRRSLKPPYTPASSRSRILQPVPGLGLSPR